MLAHLQRLPFALDPLMAEAKRRARQRRVLLAAAAVVVVAGAVAGATFTLRSSGGAVGLCATPPAGWKERTVTNASLGPPTIVLTNFRFGSMSNFYGLGASTRRWPRNGITIAVQNDPPLKWLHAKQGALRVRRSEFTGSEGSNWLVAHRPVTSNGRVLDAYVEARNVTATAVAAANRALSSVHTCSA